MSIVILEGLNGVGKTVYARELANKLGVPVYRAFKGHELDLHWNHEGEREHLLKNVFGVPLNTHIDDLYVADMLGALGASVILDRSMPSAIAYGTISTGHTRAGIARELLLYWQELLLKSNQKKCYVWLRSPWAVTKERCKGRWHPVRREWNAMDNIFSKAFYDIQMPKQQINTGDIEVADGVALICKLLNS